MHPYPHRYTVIASAAPTGPAELTSPGISALQSAPPPQFDGPGGVWSPETLLTAAVADCFVLTFRAIARARGLTWSALSCRVEALLERAEGSTRFTRFDVHATLTVAQPDDLPKAEQLLKQAEHGCLVSNSLSGQRVLHTEVGCPPTVPA